MSPLPELLTVEEVATYLRVAPNTVYRWCRSGKLPGIKIGKEWRIAQPELDKFITSRAVTAPQTSQQGYLGAFSPPDHALAMTSDPAQIYPLQAEFLQAGLEAGYPLFAGIWWEDHAEVRARLTAAGLPVAELEAAERLAFAAFGAAYDAGGAGAVLRLWEGYADRVGVSYWGTGSHVTARWDGRYEALAAYEEALHETCERLGIAALCPCLLQPVERPGFDAMMTLMPHHSSALFMHSDETMFLRAMN